MQNKANLCRFWPKNKHLWKKQSQFKAKQTQFKANSNPILSAAKMEITDFITGLYENIRLCGCAENKPNSNPKQTQFYPPSCWAGKSEISPKFPNIPNIRFFQFLIYRRKITHSINPRAGVEEVLSFTLWGGGYKIGLKCRKFTKAKSSNY
jgi:hypothetical protein